MILHQRTFKDMSGYFKEDQASDCVRYINNNPDQVLEAYVPMRYEGKNFLTLGEYVKVLGIFTCKIGDTEFGLQIPAVISADPSSTYETTIDEVEYLVLVFKPGRRIMTTMTVIQIDTMSYFIWNEFFALGNLPTYITYENIHKLHDEVKEVTGVDMGTNHVIMEMVLAHMFRDQNDLNKFYRNTNMTKPPAMVTLRDVSYGPSSTHSRLIGSYADAGRTSALLNQVSENNELDDLFRA